MSLSHLFNYREAEILETIFEYNIDNTYLRVKIVVLFLCYRSVIEVTDTQKLKREKKKIDYRIL